jgi:hypothetical protein
VLVVDSWFFYLFIWFYLSCVYLYTWCDSHRVCLDLNYAIQWLDKYVYVLLCTECAPEYIPGHRSCAISFAASLVTITYLLVGYTAGYIIAVFFIFTSIFYFSWYIIRILYMLLLYFIASGISYMLILVWVWKNFMHIGLSYGGLSLIGRGADIVLTDRVCENGCIRCVDACTPLILLFPLLFCCVLFLFWYRISVGSFTCFCRVSHHQAHFWDGWVNHD